MRVDTGLRRHFEQHGIKDISLCLYPLAEVSQPERRDLFHYHIEKCGGMAVGTALQGAAAVESQINGRPCHWVRGTSATADELERRSGVPGQVLATFVGEYGGPCFGSHKRMSEDAIPFAFFRDPFDRLVSHYYYECRRAYLPPASPDGFAAYIRAPQNICFQTQMMATTPYSGDNEAEMLAEALENLKTLAIADLHSSMENGLLQIWTRLGLPPVVTERLHSNSNKPFDFESFRTEVEEHHWTDYRLVNAVKENPRNLFEIEEGQLETIPPNGPVFLIADEQADSQAQMKAKVCELAGLKQAAAQAGIQSFSDLFDLLPE